MVFGKFGAMNPPPTFPKGRYWRPLTIARSMWPRVIELWLFFVLAAFVVTRVLGSQTGHRVLDHLRHFRLP